MSEKQLNIYQKFIEVRKVVPYLQKGASGPQFQYVSSSQVLSAVIEKMNEIGLFLEVEVVDKRVMTKEKKNSKGGETTEYFTELDLKYTWVNAENPAERVEKTWYGQGIDTAGEKGVGKALTYAEKYFILKWFNIATDKDDPDSFQEKVERTLPPKPITQEQVGTIKTNVLKFAGLRGRTEQEVYGALHITDVTKLNEQEASKAITTLEKWIAQAQQQQGA
jgi:hypothetical protein